MMDNIRISAVSYLNTFPFVYGLLKAGNHDRFELSLDVPSVCAEKLMAGEADVALVPVGALPEIGDYKIVSGYCIGAVREVKTVLLLSQEPVGQIRRIFLDSDSRTSIELIRVLAERHWKIHPDYKKLTPGEINSIDGAQAVVAIGDKTFGMRPQYRHVYDLAAEWIRFTGLPFVFAVWVTRKPLSAENEALFNAALGYGVGHIAECLEFFSDRLPGCEDCLAYLQQNISYELDEMKLNGMEKFLGFLRV